MPVHVRSGSPREASMFDRLKHWRGLRVDPAYRAWWERGQELDRLQRAPRRMLLSTRIFGQHNFDLIDGASFCSSYKEIFQRQIYAFHATSRSPRIVDGGANVGVSILYFKKLH